MLHAVVVNSIGRLYVCVVAVFMRQFLRQFHSVVRISLVSQMC